VHHLTIAGRNPFAKPLTGFQHQHFLTLAGQSPRRSKSNDTRTDNDRVRMEHFRNCHISAFALLSETMSISKAFAS
jgi:hypothetical protein